jgi:hypothetical protein
VRRGAAVFELDAHIDRTAESLRLMHSATVGAALDAALEPAAFREHFTGTMAAALRCFYAQDDAAAHEARVTMLAAWEDDTLRLYCHASELPPPPPSPVIVEVRGSPRSTAAAKVRRHLLSTRSVGASSTRMRLIGSMDRRIAHGLRPDRDWSGCVDPMSTKSFLRVKTGS